MIRHSLAALLLLTAFSTPALAAGFKIEGTDLKTAKLTFDSSGVDRSTAEGTARGLLSVVVSIRSSNLEIQFETIALGEMKRVLQPLLTSESYNDLLGSKEEKLRHGQALMKKATIKSTVEFTDTSTKDGITTLRYVMVMNMKVPCRKCTEQGDPACKKCKGTQLRDRERKVNGAVMVSQKDKLWLVTAMKKSCYRCQGTGKQDQPKQLAPPHKCAGATCATCGPQAVRGDCKGCSGSGLSDDNFFKGPRKVEGLPKLDTASPDMTSPEKAFASFGRALQARQVSQSALQSKLGEGFGAFVTFFCHPDHTPKQKVGKFSVPDYKALEVHKDGDAVAWINYAVVRDGAGPAAATKVAGKAELRKGGDGKWRVSQLSTPCWSCSYRRKNDPNFDCTKCKNTGFQKATYLP